ncbi:hypothetical protein BT96DRAFT_991390 [Gymnopus androsaceus JB14]|uniref:DUF6534 domain-containing protein n=1 Tax=Gymnopus androsaceus JB14 TaxID=1447944 RepID=A0A6A4HWG5_9AGAR|nr:hypothetical protein BT96DRAFT_991390 [Gymnopus androsaceus JB14]
MSGLSAAEQAEINLILGGTELNTPQVVGNYFSYLTMGIVLSAGIWTYDLAVTNHANPSTLTFIKWPMIAEPVLLSTCGITVQLFYAWRIWIISLRKNQILPVVIGCFSILGWCAIYWQVHTLATHNLLSKLDILLPSYIAFGCSLAADALITGSMIYYLNLRFRMRPEFPSGVSSNRFPHRSFRKLIVRTVECNLLSLLAQAIAVGLFARASVTGSYSEITGMTLAKVYTFSLLVSLNCRHPNNNYGTSGRGFSSSRGGGFNSTAISNRHGSITFPSTQIDIQRETASNWKVQSNGPAFNADELSELDADAVVSPVTG